MVSKAQIKFVKSLGLLKFRQKYDKFTAEGEKTVVEFLKSRKFKPEKVYVQHEDLLQKMESLTSPSEVEFVTASEMSQMTSFKNPSRVLAVFSKQGFQNKLPDLREKRTIYLDDIQDPGNLGTILRIADWFGISHVVRSSGTADFFHPKVIQSSMGSLCNLILYTSTLSEITSKYPDLPVIGALLEGKELEQNTNLPGNGILVIGNEGHGISSENSALITHPVSIVGHPGRIAESLNAAMACSIICFQWTR